MKQLFDALGAALERGESAVLCTILASSGSTPRGAGARMAVFEDGRTLGTVGGGAVEQEAIRQAAEVLRSGCESLQAYCLAPNQVADLGMVCGGNVTVYFQRFAPQDEVRRELLRELSCALSGRENAWLIMELRDGLVVQTGLYRASAGLQFARWSDDVLVPLLRSRAVLQQGEVTMYAEPVRRAGMVYVFGAGHVSRALVPVLKSVDFAVTVYDPRPELACREYFPDADEIILDEFSRAEQLKITAEDYVVIMTPGHQADREVLAQMLRTPATYVGCIGSRRKIEATKAYLAAQGLPAEAWQRVHAPIGLPIGGETPAEIAVSVVAQLIQHRSQQK